MEFSTEDGNNQKSKILCYKCSSYWKQYATSRYNINLEDFFCEPFCIIKKLIFSKDVCCTNCIK